MIREVIILTQKNSLVYIEEDNLYYNDDDDDLECLHIDGYRYDDTSSIVKIGANYKGGQIPDVSDDGDGDDEIVAAADDDDDKYHVNCNVIDDDGDWDYDNDGDEDDDDDDDDVHRDVDHHNKSITSMDVTDDIIALKSNKFNNFLQHIISTVKSLSESHYDALINNDDKDKDDNCGDSRLEKTLDYNDIK